MLKHRFHVVNQSETMNKSYITVLNLDHYFNFESYVYRTFVERGRVTFGMSSSMFMLP